MNKKNIFFLLGIFFIFMTILISVQTYAKYLTSANGQGNIAIAKWNISVNNLSVKNNSDISSTLKPYFPGNEHIAANIVAPNAEGYFDLDLNFSNVDVSFEYTISVIPSEESIVKDLVATSYKIDNGEIINLNSETSITKVINLNTKPNSQNVRIFIKWIDDDNSTMNNADDTLAANSSNPVALLKVTVSFKQI